MDFVSTLSTFLPARHRRGPFLRPVLLAAPAAALAAALISSGASAQTAAVAGPEQARRYSAIWLIQGKAAPTGVQTVRKGGFVVLQRLLPPSLIRLDTAVADSGNGKILVPAGAELFGLVTDGPPLYCATGRLYTQRCFADMDRDGQLDGHFTKSNPVHVLPSFSGKRPEKLKPLKGGRYSRADPRSMKAKYVVGLRFNRVNSLLQAPNPVFRIVFGTEEWTDNLTQELMPGAGPQTIEALGARFRVIALRGDEVEVEIDRTIPPQPFAVEQKTTYGYY
ncbi:MAG TPA: hypothetical protein VFR28_04100 [Allosphingosinicella sp.]|nr:hypothetical protein [Allosphingosinicella sp.]